MTDRDGCLGGFAAGCVMLPLMIVMAVVWGLYEIITGKEPPEIY